MGMASFVTSARGEGGADKGTCCQSGNVLIVRHWACRYLMMQYIICKDKHNFYTLYSLFMVNHNLTDKII